MKVELVTLLSGDLQVELITETDLEYRVLEAAWKFNGYIRGNGQSIAPCGGSTGFYIPLCKLRACQESKSDG